MKPTQRKDALRNIRKQFVSFLSILIVVSLGVGIFLACYYGAIACGLEADALYEQTKFHDIEIRATKGVAEGDTEAVRALEGVADAEAVFGVDLIAETPKKKVQAHAASLTERIDLPNLLEGRMPRESYECVVEQDLLTLLGLSVGDRITLRDATAESKSKYLYRSAFRITGSVLHPENYHTQHRAGYNVLIPRSAFDTKSVGVENTTILIRAETEGLSSFSDEYRDKIVALEKRLVGLGQERAALHDEAILSEAEGQLAEGSAELEDAYAQLEKVRKQLANGEIELDAAEKELETNKKKLDEAKIQLDAAEKQLAEGKQQLDDAEAQLAAAKSELDDARTQLSQAEATLDEKQRELDDGLSQLRVARSTLDAAEATLDQEVDPINATIEEVRVDIMRIFGIDDLPQIHVTTIRELTDDYTLTWEDSFRKVARYFGWPEQFIEAALDELGKHPLWIYQKDLYNQIPDGERQYEEGMAQYNEGSAAIAQARAEYEAGRAEYNRGRDEYEDGHVQLEAKKSEYNVNKQLFDSNKASYEDGLAQYEAGLAEFNKAKKQLESGEKEFAEAEKEYAEGEAKLESGRRELAEYQAGNWITLDRRSNLTWHEISESMRTFRAIGSTFAILFVFLGVLVCYATIGKIIDEQRRLVGTTKALGFTPREIFNKYLLFGGLAALLGCIAGTLLSYFVLEQLIVDKVAGAYHFDMIHKFFSLLPAILAIAVGLFVAAISTRVACRRLLAQPATRLISGEIPPTFTKKEKIGERKQMSLYSSLIGRNIRTDLKRVMITIVSIAGCCILLLIGFSMKNSFVTLIDRQFDRIIAHELVVRYLPGRTEDTRKNIHNILEDAGVSYTSAYQLGTIVRIGTSQEVAQLVCCDPDSLMNFYHLTDIRRNKEMRIPDEGVVIFRRLAEVYKLEVGDHISLMDAGGKFIDTPIVGVCETYAGRSLFLSREYAEKIFGDEAQGNVFMVNTNGADADALEQQLRTDPGFLRVDNATKDKKGYQDVAEATSTVILVMILMAGIMAAVVLLNLLRIQINQKQRELTIMRVNGFTTRETVGYILRENILTTLLGVALGLVAGNLIAQMNLRAIERVEIQMIRTPNPQACIFSVLITLGFAALMNYLALRKVRYLKLSDVNG